MDAPFLRICCDLVFCPTVQIFTLFYFQFYVPLFFQKIMKLKKWQIQLQAAAGGSCSKRFQPKMETITQFGVHNRDPFFAHFPPLKSFLKTYYAFGSKSFWKFFWQLLIPKFDPLCIVFKCESTTIFWKAFYTAGDI